MIQPETAWALALPSLLAKHAAFICARGHHAAWPWALGTASSQPWHEGTPGGIGRPANSVFGEFFDHTGLINAHTVLNYTVLLFGVGVCPQNMVQGRGLRLAKYCRLKDCRYVVSQQRVRLSRCTRRPRSALRTGSGGRCCGHLRGLEGRAWVGRGVGRRRLAVH